MDYEDAKTNLRTMRHFRAAAFLTKIFEIFGLSIAQKVFEKELPSTIEAFLSRINDFLDLPANTHRIRLSNHLRVADAMTVKRMKTAILEIFMENSGNLCDDPQDQPFLPDDFARYARIQSDNRFIEEVKRVIVTYQWEKVEGQQDQHNLQNQHYLQNQDNLQNQHNQDH